jgi:hypothetical protein
MSVDECHGHSQVTLTGQPGRSTGLERLGFFGDTVTRAAPQVGPWTALLQTGPWAALRAGPTTAPSCRWTFGPVTAGADTYGWTHG